VAFCAVNWAFINNGCVHGIQRSDTTIKHCGGQRCFVQDTVAVLALSKAFAVLAALAMAVALAFLLSPENPRETSRQTVQSQRTVEYVLPLAPPSRSATKRPCQQAPSPPVQDLSAGIIMMTAVAGALAYFGWWTKAGVAVAVGLAMIVLAGTLPAHGTLILFAGLGVFALAATTTGIQVTEAEVIGAIRDHFHADTVTLLVA